MPELPEVETVRRGLEPAMAGRRLARVIQRRPDLRFLLPQGFATRLTGRRIESLGRRAKYLLARLDGGEVLIMHLGMSGRFTITPSRRLDGISSPLAGEVARSAGGGRGEAAPTNNARSAGGGKAPSSASGSPPPPLRGTSPARGEEKKRLVGEFTLDTGTDPAHDHIVFETDDGTLVTYNDPRRFGFMDLVPDSDLDTCRHFAGMGPEPLGNTFDSAYLATRAFGRSADIKTFLLDQRNIAGLGNIYVCEALFRIGLSPHRAASCLAIRGAKPSDRCQRLVPAIRDVLTEAIAAGGSTLRDYAKADGSLGYFQHSFKVYGREGEPCTTQGCGGMIKRTVQGGRSTFHCGRCQR